jgi:hypothetical protein
MYIQFKCNCMGYTYDLIHKFTYTEDNKNYSYEKCNLYFKNVLFKEIIGPIPNNYMNYEDDHRFQFINIRNCICNRYSIIPNIYNFSIYLSESEMCYIIKDIQFFVKNNHI